MGEIRKDDKARKEWWHQQQENWGEERNKTHLEEKSGKITDW